MNIVSIAPKAYVGVNAVFEHLTPMIGSKHHYLEDFPLASEESADLYIFGGWVPNVYPLLFRMLNERDERGPQIAVLNCSSLGQMEMAQVEMRFLQEMMQFAADGVIDYVFLGDEDAALCFDDQPGVRYFPYPIQTDMFDKHRGIFEAKLPSSVGMFSPAHYRKNLINQIMGCKLANQAINDIPPITLHSNLQLEVGGVQKQFWGWLPRVQFFQKISEMKTTLHCGFTESFCYAALESIMLGTLPILSPVITNNFQLNDYELMVVDIDQPRAIGFQIKNVLEMDVNDYSNLLHKTMTGISQLETQHTEMLRLLFEAVEDTQTVEDTDRVVSVF